VHFDIPSDLSAPAGAAASLAPAEKAEKREATGNFTAVPTLAPCIGTRLSVDEAPQV